jgi:hypothetical protein
MPSVSRTHVGSNPACSWCYEKITNIVDVDLAPLGVFGLHHSDKCLVKYYHDDGVYEKITRNTPVSDQGRLNLNVIVEQNRPKGGTPDDFKSEYDSAALLAQEHKQQVRMLGQWYEGNETASTPDFIVGNEFWELKTITKKGSSKTIQDHIDSIHKQTSKNGDDRYRGIIKISKNSSIYHLSKIELNKKFGPDIRKYMNKYRVGSIWVERNHKYIFKFEK